MMKKLKVREGNTGILYLTDGSGKQERYIPNYDLDQARALLLEFQELGDTKGERLKDNYRREGYNWYPTMVSYLYWHVFFRYVKYEPLVRSFLDGEVSFQYENSADFHALMKLLEGTETVSTLKTRLFYLLVRLNNWIVLRKYLAEILFFRFTPKDFRSVEIVQALQELRARYIEVLLPEKDAVLNNLPAKRPYYFIGGALSKNFFGHSYDLSSFDRYKRILFQRAIERAEWMISGFIKEYRRHLRALKNTRSRVFYGFDDANGYIFPILYACQRRGMKTVAHQHGAYVKRHAAYVMEGIKREDYRWFDKLIVWGDYWKDHLLHISHVYSPESVVVGSNKLARNYSSLGGNSTKPKNVLVPYEFLTNTYKVGRYIEKLIDLGYTVYFKPRSDEKLEDQLEAYCLKPEYRDKLKIADRIDETFMQGIDIIAGTMTTLVYELLPYNKITWVLETEYRHLEDLAEEGYAHRIRYEELENLDEQYFTSTEVDPSYFFNPETLKDTLRKHVLGSLA
jgi:hypothetical protein